jgi:Carboxypeptidase regulatory-like domain/TonB-dependent Receptor Plug Domain
MAGLASRLAGILVLAAVTAAPAAAQITTGSILVKTIDEQGGAMPGVAVTISSPTLVAGRASGTTDASGSYRFPSLPPGVYRVTVELQGFQTIVREGIRVLVGDTATVELGMKVAGLAEVLTVSAESPVVDTTSANVNVHIDQKLLETTPGGRDIWSIVEYKVPGLVMGSPDVGGNQGGLQRSMSVRGTPNSQNTQMLNGVNVGDPAAIGFAGYYYDPSAFADIQVSSGAQDISVPSGGVFVNMVTKTGTNRFQGEGLFTFQADGTQWDNIDAPLRDAGIRPNANAVDTITNLNLNAGGPILQNRLFYFAALNDQRTHVNVVGFPAVEGFGQPTENTDITSVLANSTYQLSGRHRLQGTFSRQVYDKPNRGANNGNTPESTWHEHDVLAVYQGLWNWVMSDRMFADTRVSYNSIDFPLNLKTDGQTLLDLTSGIRTRANQTDQEMFRRRLQTSANVQYFVPRFLGGRHELRAGIDNAYTPEDVDLTRNGDVSLTYRSAPAGSAPAGPVQVQIFNTPLHLERAVNATALYAQDAFSYKRLTVVGGLRWERVEGWIPRQQNPPSVYFPEGTVLNARVGGQDIQYAVRRSFDEVRDIPLWKNVGPRLSGIVDLTGKGRTAVKASAARYYETIGTGTPSGLSPNGTISQTFNWNDLNGDLIFQNGEQGALTNTTVPATFETLALTRDPNLKRPYRNEYTIGIDHELIRNLRLSATYIRVQERDNVTNVELSVPFDAYTAISVREQGRDGRLGTDDDRDITVYNENLPLQTHVTQQRNDDRVAQRADVFEVTATKRYSNRWMLLAGYTWSKVDVERTSVVNPNAALVNASGRSGGREHQFKMTGSYELPYGVMLGGNFRLESGAFVTRTVQIAGLNQGNVTVNAEPRGSVTLDTLPTIDLRIGKVFRLGANTFEVDMDAFNITNENTVFDVRAGSNLQTVRVGGTGETRVIPQFLSPTGILGPRILRFNVTYRFGG